MAFFILLGSGISFFFLRCGRGKSVWQQEVERRRIKAKKRDCGSVSFFSFFFFCISGRDLNEKLEGGGGIRRRRRKNMTVNHIHAKFAGNCFSRTKILISGQRSGQNLFLDKILVCMFWQILRFANVLCAEASHLFSPFSRSLGQFSRRRDFIFSRSFAGRQRVLCCFCLLRPKFRLHITHPSPSRFFWACMQKQARPPSSSSSSPGKQTETQKSFLFSKRGN